MALIDITPVMTSNTTPAPYVVSVSGIYSTGYEGYKAFNGSISGIDSWAIKGQSGWIKIDFGNTIKINGFSISARESLGNGGVSELPKSFILYGSNDDIKYEQILPVSEQVMWVKKEERLFVLSNSINFRYYRITVTSNNGHIYTAIGKIKFWQDDTITPTITNTKASMNYCLPKNSTLAMTQRQNDEREGLLGFANDSDNYGTLWMIDNKGQAIIPKANMTNYDTLFDGFNNTKFTTVTLSKDISKYRFLQVIGSMTTFGMNLSIIIPVKDIIYAATDSYQYILSQYATSSIYTHIRFNFLNSNTITIQEVLSPNWGIGLHKVLGFY